MIEYSILLEAIDPVKNIWRQYSLEAGVDLFDGWFVQIKHGRKGAQGSLLHVGVKDMSEAIQYINQCLNRRKTAKNRIGVPYTLKCIKGAWRGVNLAVLEAEEGWEPNDPIPF
jgi:hypothetical protein